MIRARIAVPLALAVIATAWAADVTGKWKGTMEGTGSVMVLDLKSAGASVTGTMSGADGKAHPITKGSLEGDKISLTVASEWQGSPVTLEVTGTVSGDTMHLNIEAEGGAWGTEAVVKRAP